MIQTEYRLEESVSVTLVAGAGNRGGIGPKVPGESWKIRFFGASGPNSARLQIMRGEAFDASRQLDLTDRADGDTSETDITLQTNETISFWWTGGVSGSVMMCSIQGSRFVPGRRAY